MTYEAIDNCRSCGSKEMISALKLGSIASCGLFLNEGGPEAPLGELRLLHCTNCDLLQLDRNFNLNELFNIDYGYESALNESMKKHIHEIFDNAISFLNINSPINILDIGSNDGTLLNYASTNYAINQAYGVDPTISMFKERYLESICTIPDFFSCELATRIKGKFQIITSIAMFYDLPNPNDFVLGINKLLDENGIWIVELSYLYSMIEKNAVDTICHEHLEYYSCLALKYILDCHNLKVVRCELNGSNGGSIRLFVSHKNSEFTESKTFLDLINKEKNNKNSLISSLEEMMENVKVQITKMDHLIKQSTNLPLNALGASTKGNLILQVFPEISKKIEQIGEVNARKFGKFTPGTRIEIVDEKILFANGPSYYVLLPWHFKDNMVKKYADLIDTGEMALISLFPKFEITKSDKFPKPVLK